MSERNNVLLVVLDSVRAENTSLHGYDRETTPFLSSFADRSTVYTQARAPGIHSIASHVSMFTGAHVEAHEALRHTAEIDLKKTIWHELEAEFGYSTGLFTNNRIVSHASNLGDGFDHVHVPDYPLAERFENAVDGTMLEQAYFRTYDGFSHLRRATGSLIPERVHPGRLVTGVSAGIGKLTSGSNNSDPPSSSRQSGYKTLHGGAFTEAFLDWQSRQDGPWAACINLMDPHSPYEPLSEYDKWATDEQWEIQRNDKPSIWETLAGKGWDRVEALEGLYDGGILQSDQIVEDLVADLEAAGVLSETLLVITSDHGEAFGEQSQIDPTVRLRDHKWGIHEVLTHVPLVVSYPGQETGREVSDVVSLTDTPTLLRSAATGQPQDPLTETDEVLASTFRLPAEKVSKYGSIDDIENYVGPWRAVYETTSDGLRKYAQHGADHVTLDIDDAGSTTVISREPQERVAAAFEQLTDEDILTQRSTDIDEGLEEQLEDLGYIR